ncbi:MAG: LPS-assembly protein LptD [Rhodospirillaceae bacterium]|nr:MAG: LPS-assembly protein LptD [Rhodospirillaceae bacterium]
MNGRLFSAGKRSPSSALVAALLGASVGLALCGHAGGAQAAATHAPVPADERDQQTLMQADEVNYDKDTDVVTASGKVEIQRAGQILLADKVVYNRTTDTATATGHVSLIEPNGTVAYVEKIDVSGDLKQALAGEIRVMMADKSRMTGRAFRRTNDRNDEIYQGVYTACDVCAGKSPLWRVQADRVNRDVDAQMIYYHDLWLDIKGVPVFYTPYLSSPDPTAGRKSGLLNPEFGGGSILGVYFAQPYYFNIAPDRDATITPFISSNAGKGATVEYRQDFQNGRFDFFGTGVDDNNPTTPHQFRGNIHSMARWDMTDNWRSGAVVSLASDQTYLREFSALQPPSEHVVLPYLTTNAFAERFGANSYFSANAYYFQRQLNIVAQPSPIVAPLLNYNYTSNALPWGGYLKVDASGAVLTRIDGSDSDRLSTAVSWDLPFTTPQGYVFTARAAFRADGYYISDFVRPSNGRLFSGTVGRTLPEVSLEWQWPLERASTNFTQVIEPIAMIMAAPIAHNPETIPNEDSSDFEFTDSNLFEDQRRAGFDRVEGGVRAAYGLRWSAYNKGGGSISALIGQSYSFHRDMQFAPLSGLFYNLSDYVGHVDFSPNQYVSLQYRFRLDKDTFANRSTEVTGVVGPEMMRVVVSYINIPPTYAATPAALALNPDAPGAKLQKELYTAIYGRISRDWSFTVSHRLNLVPGGGGSLQTGVGLKYEDECFALDLNVTQDNTSDRDYRGGFGLLLTFNFKTIGNLKFNTNVGG